jgi:hypothetical protein
MFALYSKHLTGNLYCQLFFEAQDLKSGQSVFNNGGSRTKYSFWRKGKKWKDDIVSRLDSLENANHSIYVKTTPKHIEIAFHAEKIGFSNEVVD